MRHILKDISQVCHYWANKVQSEGKAGNVFFRDSKIWSYGHHFCIARHLPSGAVAFTTRGYSPSTQSHINKARSAARHLQIVYCNDPNASASQNMEHARNEIRYALDAAERPRIRSTTRAAHKASALRTAEQANAYLAALPDSEKGTEFPIDTAELEGLRAALALAEQAAETLRAEQHAARLADLQSDLQRWRNFEPSCSSLHSLPPALRLNTAHGVYDGGLLPTRTRGQCVQTSHGAEIPVSDALKLWPVILRVKAGQKDYTPGEPLGVYRLTAIRADGSIRVGCHDIEFAEIEAIARQLNLIGV